MNWNLVATLAVKSTAVFVFAYVLALVLRRRSAAERHLVWTAAFVTALALPVLSLSLPPLGVSIKTAVPQPLAAFQATAAAPESTVSGPAQPSFAVLDARRPFVPARFNWGSLLMWMWAAGAAVGFVQMLVAWVTLHRKRSEAEAWHDADVAALTELLGIDRDVQILKAPAKGMPMAFGFRRPVVFMPTDAWDADRRRLVLTHELAHIRRGDALSQLLARAALNLHWWNPVAWMAWREFVKERERAADDLVLNTGARASEYAGLLLDVARGEQAHFMAGSAAVAMARRSQLEGRLSAILDPVRNRKASQWLGIRAALLAAAVAAIPLAALQAQNESALPGDFDAAFRVASAQKNPAMLEDASKAALNLRKYELARKLLEASLSIRAEQSGTQSVSYAQGLIAIGDMERRRGDLDTAAPYYTQALTLLEGHPEAAPALLGLGIRSLRDKDFETADDFFRRAEVAAALLHPGQALMWRAVVREKQNSLEEAEDLYKRALAANAASLEETALITDMYAQFLRRQGRTDEAQPLAEQALGLRKQGQSSPLMGQSGTPNLYRVGNGVAPPKLTKKVEPEYTEEARSAKYQGTMVLYTEVGIDGLAHNTRVIRGLGLGLEDKAIEAIGQWRFSPGSKDGQPVNVAATIEVNFRLF